MHDLKTWQILATNHCEMPLNQQLQPSTEYKIKTHGRLQYAWPLVGLEHIMNYIEQKSMHMHKGDYNELGP